MKTVKFYVGEMSSHWNDRKEAHVLERLDFVLSADNEEGIAFIDASLRNAEKEFIRSDNRCRTLADISLLAALREAVEIIEGTGLDASVQRDAIAKATGAA